MAINRRGLKLNDLRRKEIEQQQTEELKLHHERITQTQGRMRDRIHF